MISDLEGTDNIRDAFVSIPNARFSPSGAYIGCVITSHITGVPSRVRIWDVTPGGAVNQRDIEGEFRTIAFTADSKTIVAGRKDGAACLYATNTGALLATLHGHVSAPNVEADPNNLLLATYSGEDNFVHVWQIDGPA
jgi:WD40 repeat protein